MRVRLIGDCHQDYDSLLPILKDADHYIQVGDMGLSYRTLRAELPADFPLHVIFGNHDNLDRDSQEYFKSQFFYIGDYGYHVVDKFSYFYLGGAYSIDHEWRKRRQNWPLNTGPVSWWEEEELSIPQLRAAIDLYSEVKPDYLIAHECPLSLVPYVTNPDFVVQFGWSPGHVIQTRTNVALQQMLEIHKPKLICGGHYHIRKSVDLGGGSKYVCLDMLHQGRNGQLPSILDLEV